MVNCAVPSCKNDSRRQTKQNSNVTFHRFPRNEELVKKWVAAVQRPDWEPTIRSFVCSAHFPEPCMYFSKSGLRKLVQDAVPQLLLHSVETHKKKKKTKTKSKIKTYTSDKTFSLDKVKKERDTNDLNASKKLKKRIINLTKLSKRRRLRCNALYASLNRIRKKVTNVVSTLKGLQTKIAENEELGRVLETYGVSPQELFQGLGNRERSPTPETQEEEYCYAEVPAAEARRPPARRPTVHTSSYPPPPLVPEGGPRPPPDAEPPAVKTEEASPGASPAHNDVAAVPEPVFVDASAACRVCALGNVPPQPAGRPLRELYQRLTGAQLVESSGGGLCDACLGELQRCLSFAELARRAEAFHAQGAISEIKMTEEL